MAMLAGSALMFGAVPSLAEADEPAGRLNDVRLELGRGDLHPGGADLCAAFDADAVGGLRRASGEEPRHGHMGFDRCNWLVGPRSVAMFLHGRS